MVESAEQSDGPKCDDEKERLLDGKREGQVGGVCPVGGGGGDGRDGERAVCDIHEDDSLVVTGNGGSGIQVRECKYHLVLENLPRQPMAFQARSP